MDFFCGVLLTLMGLTFTAYAERRRRLGFAPPIPLDPAGGLRLLGLGPKGFHQLFVVLLVGLGVSVHVSVHSLFLLLLMSTL